VSQVQLRLPDGSVVSHAAGTTLAEVAALLSAGLARRALAGQLGGRPVDLAHRLGDPLPGAPRGTGVETGAETGTGAADEALDLRFLTWDDEAGRGVGRHSAAHVLAQAVKELYPAARLAIGPAIADGFYYDFDVPEPFQPDDLRHIEERMRDVASRDLPFSRREAPRERAIAEFQARNEPYKVELIEDLPADAAISMYRQGEPQGEPQAGFEDLCAGPHVPSTGRIGCFQLLHAAGAYWRGDERRPMLQRIYGTAFGSEKELKAHLERLAEAEKRDHRNLGAQLDLFSIHREVGPGLAVWHPKGGAMRAVVEEFWRERHRRNGYDIVYSPHIGKAQLWETSGHLGFYAENMYAPMSIDGQDYYIKPMNCPFHIMIYKDRQRSYRDLPLRFAELGTVYRYERSGVLHGLLRVRGFTQDDAHIFCTPEQVKDEILGCIDFMGELWRAFGFKDFVFFLSTRPEKFVGDPADWELAEDALRRAMQTRGLSFEVDPGGGVFYGPKIDVKVRDAIGRLWQCTTIQFDFNLPESFDLTFIGQDGKEHRPFMVHRTLLGAMERFFGILIEHYAGAFPLWLAPVQARVLPVVERNADYARAVLGQLRDAGLRADIDVSETISYRIRRAQVEKVPYMLVVGDREAEAGTVAVRHRASGDLGPVPAPEFIARLVGEAAPPVKSPD
jgi:threonyl-tRNA synthetase